MSGIWGIQEAFRLPKRRRQDDAHASLRALRVSAAGLATVAALVLSACASAGPAAQEAATGQPVEGGELVVGVATDTKIIDPHLTGSSITATITRNVVDSLVGQAEDNSFTPWLAESWEINDDNTLYTFTLREGVTFSDGDVLDAEAVKTNLDRVLDPETLSVYAKSLLGPVTEVTAVDARTLTIAYDTPFATLLQGLSLPYLGIQSPKHLEETADTTTSVVGSGPFVLESFVPGQGSSLSKRADYDWGPGYAQHTGPAYLDSIEFTYLPEASTRLGTLTNGQTQIIDEVPPANAEQLSSTDGIELETYENPGVNYAFQLNTQRAPFDDVKVRQAFQSALDVESSVEATFFGTLAPADNILGPATLYYDESVADLWGFDEDKANTLLDEAGWTDRDSEGYRTKDGERLAVDWVYNEASTGQLNATLVQSLQSQVKEIGFEIVLVPTDEGGQTAASEAGDYDLSSFFYVRAEPDILRTVYHSDNIPPAGGNLARVSTLDALLEEGVGATDDRREEIYSEVQTEIIEQAYSVPLYVAAFQLGRSTDVQGITWATNAKPLFYDVWLTS
ncbi:MAG: ABC transporter substrate-binding protein [Pseudoclavibacter sp.]